MAHEILVPGFVRTDERGMFVEVLNDGSWQALISGRMNRDAVMGNHYHRKTVVFFFLATGAARIKTVNVETAERDDFVLQGGQGVMLGVNESHSIRFQELSDFVMLKSRRYDPADPDTYHFPVED
jgi:dTDP-4-dehydrorhamnose 3,5-epimerase-like enzyme